MGTKTKDRSSSLKWLWAHTRGRFGMILVQIFCYVLNAATTVVFALLVRDVIDCAAGIINGAKQVSDLVSYAVYLGLLILLQLFLRFFCRYLTDRLTADLERHYQSVIYREMLKKEFGKISSYHTGELLNRLFSDVSVIADGAAGILPTVAATVTRLVCAVGVMAFLEWRFTLIFFGGGILVFLISRLYSGTLKRMHREMQEAQGKTRSFMQETLSNLLVLKVFEAEEKTARRARKLQDTHFKLTMRKKVVGALANVGFSALFRIGYFGALIWCALSLSGVISGSVLMTYGTMMAILQLVNQIQTPFGSLSGILPRYYGMCASIDRLREIENLPRDAERKPLYPDAESFHREFESVEFEQITFRYDAEDVLRDASVSIKRGDFCVITGLSGIGKSTLLKLLLGVYQPDGGEIFFVTKRGKTGVHSAAPGVFAYVPQGNMLLSGTIRENITLIREDASEEEILEAARVACVTDYLDDLPNGLDTYIGEKGFGLSEGQIQRIAIARAILSGAPILLLDESTSALDEQTERKMLRALTELKDKTCIIVSHKRAAFEICNAEIVLSDKKIEKRELDHAEL